MSGADAGMSAPERMKVRAREFLDAQAAGDTAGLQAMMVDDVRWWVQLSVEGRVPRPLVGAREVAQFASGEITASFVAGSTTWRVHHMTAEDDRVAVLAQRLAVGANGWPYDNEYHWLFRFEGDRIAEIWEVLDTSHAFTLLTLDPASWRD